jgi:hypothetical protein
MPSSFGEFAAAATSRLHQADIRGPADTGIEGVQNPLREALVHPPFAALSRRVSPNRSEFMRNGSHLAPSHSRSVVAGWVDDKIVPLSGRAWGTAALTVTEASTVPRSDWTETPLRDTLATPVSSVGKDKLGHGVG